MSQAFLGIDGGGTRTDLAIVDETGAVIVRRQGPTSNKAVVGFEQASAALVTLITESATEVKLPLPISAGWIGMAGSDRPKDRETFHSALAYLIADLRITNDAELVLSGTPEGTGIALIAGTGSIAFARNEHGLTARSGGWGHIFGDEGSAYGVAVDALRGVAAAADGLGPATELTPALLAFWHAATPHQLIPRVHDPAVRKADIAASAPVIHRVAESGDKVAVAILQRAGDALAGLVMSLAHRIPFQAPPAVACTGGLILASEAIRNRLVSRLDPEWVRLELQPVEDIAVSVAQAVRRHAIRGAS